VGTSDADYVHKRLHELKQHAPPNLTVVHSAALATALDAIVARPPRDRISSGEGYSYIREKLNSTRATVSPVARPIQALPVLRCLTLTTAGSCECQCCHVPQFHVPMCLAPLDARRGLT
jgi:hypothetical protein